MFPSSHPYLLGMRGLQQLNREAIGEFFVASLALPAEDRVRLTGQVAHCLAESDGKFDMDLLEEIEAGCINKVKDRLMRTIKIGQEGEAEGKADGKFDMDLLEEIEAGCINKVEDRIMPTIKIGREGWLEQGFKKAQAGEGLGGKLERNTDRLGDEKRARKRAI